MTTDITELAQRIKAAAEKATPGEWVYFPKNTSIEYDVGSDESQGSILYVDSGDFTQAQTDRNGEFIALANPANILALVEALESEKRICATWRKTAEANSEKLEKAQDKADVYDMLRDDYGLREKGVGLADFVDWQANRIAELESRTVTPVNYSENTDADHCRKWAWQQVKGEVSTEEWTTGDNITYFGFFCWGWDMRRQYNEQRTVTVKIPYLPDDCDRTEAHYKYQAALRDAGIKVEAE
ncbi:TPA: ead/Ea22-like family protein [Klebsiella quasipneumoniae]|nr:ead/Ea22-like family protein [Klebsiella quasipneumoniae]